MKEQKPASKFRNMLDGFAEKLMTFNSDIDDGEYVEEEFEEAQEQKPTVGGYREEAAKPQRASANSSYVASVHAVDKQSGSNVISINRDNMPQKSVEVTDPADLEEASRCINYLLQGAIVTINLETVDKEDAQRVADFISGAVYAVNASIKRLSDNIFIITPAGVSISGGAKDESTPASARYDLPKAVSYR